MQAQLILDLVFETRNFAKVQNEDIDAIELNHSRQLAKVQAFIQKSEPVHMILPAFPAKSPNPRKTVTNKPDYGEVLALKRLNNLCARISQVYAPGAHIKICSDGRVFGDVVQVSDGAIDIYSREIRNIILDNELDHLSTFSLEDVFSAHDYDLMRSRLVSDFAESTEVIRERVKTDAEAKAIFNGIHRFMFEDGLALNPSRSRNEIKESSKHVAYEVIRRSNAWSRLVENQFPESLRLSIHPQSICSPKIGISLLPSRDSWRTPWHSVTVFDGNDFCLVTRERAEAEGGVLTYAFGKYPYYVLPTKKQHSLHFAVAVS